MTNSNIFNVLDTYYTELSTDGYLAYYNVHNLFSAIELIETYVNPLYAHVFEDYPEYLVDINNAVNTLEHNTYFLEIVRPFDITIPIF